MTENIKKLSVEIERMCSKKSWSACNSSPLILIYLCQMLGIKILANEMVVVSHPLKSIEEVLARAGESSKGRRKPLNAFILRPRLCLECRPSSFRNEL